MNKKTLGAICAALIAVAGIAGYLVLKGAREGLPGLTGKKILMVIAPGNFNDTELETPMQVLGDAGADISIASTTTDTITGMYGKEVKPDMKLEQVEVQSYDAVIFVGGTGAAVYFQDALAHSIATDAFEQGKKVCAICIAPVILANAGILYNRQATVYNGYYIEILVAGGAIYTGESITVDGNIITANGPQVAEEFAWRIAEELGV